MNEKYIRKNKNSCTINKNSKNYGKFTNIDDAIIIRDLLIENDWNLESIKQIHKIDEKYLIITIIDEKIHIIGCYDEKPSQKTIEDFTKKLIRNPNNSKYGLNITRVFETFVIKKQIAGDEYVFGYYDNLKDAEFVRNFLMDNMWNVGEFSQIQFDEETDTYKVVEVIDDKVYVLDTFENENEIDLGKIHEEFLAKISKHKLGLASHPYLDELTGKIDELEKQFGVLPTDDVWSFKNTQNPLNDIIFNLTPFQKIVYDSIDGEKTLDEIAQALVRYKSKNFKEKIERNLDQLIDMGLVGKNRKYYKK